MCAPPGLSDGTGDRGPNDPYNCLTSRIAAAPRSVNVPNRSSPSWRRRRRGGAERDTSPGRRAAPCAGGAAPLGCSGRPGGRPRTVCILPHRRRPAAKKGAGSIRLLMLASRVGCVSADPARRCSASCGYHFAVDFAAAAALKKALVPLT
jgi:hypothetical protein